MKPEEFIEKNIKQQLEKGGVDPSIAHRLAVKWAGKYGMMGNQNGKLFDNLLAHAKAEAKMLTKAAK